MTISLTKYTDVARPLTKEEVDGNWDVLIDAISALQEGGIPQIVGINSESDAGGQYLTFVFSDGSTAARIPFPAAILQAGAWASGATYTTRHIATNEGGTFLCIVAHTSGEDFGQDFDGGKWLQLGSAAATAIDFAPGDSGLTATTMQEAIIELNDKIEGSNLTAAAITYDNTTSGLSSTFVQGAVDEIAGKVAVIEDALASNPGGSDDQTAAEVQFTPVAGTSATNVQAAVADAFSAIADLESSIGGTDDQTAAEVPFTPPSGMTATDVQAAIVEVKGLIGTGGGAVSAGDVTINATGWTMIGGSSVQDALAGTDSQLASLQNAILNFSISADNVGYSGETVASFLTGLDNRISTLNSDEVSHPYNGTVRAALDEIISRLEALESA